MESISTIILILSLFNYACVILDVCPVRIGEHTMIGPNTHIYIRLAIHGFNYRFTFLVVDKEFFRQIYHEYEIDKEIVRKCLSADTDVIVVYTGVTRVD